MEKGNEKEAKSTIFDVKKNFRINSLGMRPVKLVAFLEKKRRDQSREDRALKDFEECDWNHSHNLDLLPFIWH